jgi:hypothetical protein
MSNRRDLTEEEERYRPIYFTNPYFSLTDYLVHAFWLEQEITSLDGNFPWTFKETNKPITTSDLENAYPNLDKVTNVDYIFLDGTYHDKKVTLNFQTNRWIYRNNKEVQFSDSEDETSDQEPSHDPPEQPDSDNEQAEVSQILESATQTVASLITRISRPQTPQTPQYLPGALPNTPGPSSRTAYPTPSPFKVPGLPQTPVTPQPTSSSPPVITVATATPAQVQVPPVHHAMANPAPPKAIGATPEPFDGKPEKAEGFWQNLANYYYLNADLYPDQGKKVSSALTYFKNGTPAGEWARDKQKTALSATPVDFGTWADFKTAFDKHFIPAHSALEATNSMYTSRMGQRSFNEWYQDWSTYASRSGANEESKMFAFRKAIPPALHQKIMGVTPQPNTLDGLVDKAREFDRVWRLFSNPAFTGNSGRTQGPRNRAMIADEDGTHVNATTTTRPPMMGKLTKEEKDRRYKEKLCFYCGKPNHTAKDCRMKTNQQRQGNFKPRTQRPGSDFKARATTTQEESYEEAPEEHPAQISSIYLDHRPASEDEDF